MIVGLHARAKRPHIHHTCASTLNIRSSGHDQSEYWYTAHLPLNISSVQYWKTPLRPPRPHIDSNHRGLERAYGVRTCLWQLWATQRRALMKSVLMLPAEPCALQSMRNARSTLWRQSWIDVWMEAPDTMWSINHAHQHTTRALRILAPGIATIWHSANTHSKHYRCINILVWGGLRGG